MDKQFWTAKTLDLPRWAWASMLAGGLLIGLYLRSHSSKGEAEEEEPVEEGYLNSGNLMPPSEPISGGGGGMYGISPEKSAPPPAESEKPPEEVQEEPEAPELPESVPPPEVVVPHPNPAPVENEPIKLPGHGPGQPAPTPGETITPGGPKPPHKKKEKVGPGEVVPIGNNCPAGTVANINQARNEINRLQGEIDGLQNHINQLTNVLQQYPKAKQRGQWEAERNQDRANIDNKRNAINQQQTIIANGRAQPGCGNV